MNDFDVIVLGGGSAGSSAAAAAAHDGARTLLINDGELGGLCILRGCMPTKAMLASAHALHEATRTEPFGIRLEGTVRADFPRIMARKREQVARFQRAKIRSILAQPYEVLDGRGRFAPGGGVRVGDRALRADAYVIATGSLPTRLEIPGIEEVPVWNSDDVMELETRPDALVVQGAGPIGLELAQFFARVGTRVLLVNRSPLLKLHEPEFGEELARALNAEPRIELAAPGRIERLEPSGSGLVARGVRERGGAFSFEADALLMATGRSAALQDLGLEHVRVRVTGGRLSHDRRMRTSDPAIYVAGDATGTDQILHIANHEGAIAGHNAAGADPPREFDSRLRMSVVFTDPPFAHVGATPSQARLEGGEPIFGEARFPETGRAITMSVHHGLWRLYADRASGEIIGSTILGPRADDLIHVIATLMHFRARIDRVLDLPWYHPTLSEVMLNLARDAARKLEFEISDEECPPPASRLPE